MELRKMGSLTQLIINPDELHLINSAMDTGFEVPPELEHMYEYITEALIDREFELNSEEEV